MSCPPCLKTARRRMGSSAAPSSSAMFSRAPIFQKRTPFSRLRRKFLSVSLIMSIPFSAKSLPMFLMYRLACPCGSMQSGQRLAADMTIPFSMLTWSEGRPQMFQLRMTVLIPIVETTLAPDVRYATGGNFLCSATNEPLSKVCGEGSEVRNGTG